MKTKNRSVLVAVWLAGAILACGSAQAAADLSLVPESAGSAPAGAFALVDNAGTATVAGDKAPEPAPGASTMPTVGEFLRGDKTLSVTGGYSFGDSETFHLVTVTGGYFFRDHIAINASLVGHFVNTDDSDTLGVEFNLIPRWHFYVDDRWSAFIELGAGVVYFDHNLTPPDGTHFNFTPQGGMGLTYKLEERTHLIGGVRWQHISNGALHGADRHTGSNTAVAFLGVMWEF